MPCTNSFCIATTTSTGGSMASIVVAIPLLRIKEASPVVTATRDGDTSRPTARPRAGDMALWLGLTATGSALLLAATNQICQDVAVVLAFEDPTEGLQGSSTEVDPVPRG